MPSGEAVRVDRDGHVLVVTIDRPEARNAINGAVTEGLGRALEAAEADPEVRAVVLTGAGDRSFSAGADLKAVAAGESLNPPGTEGWGFAGFVQHPISKPVVAAVNGTALGGGTELVLACDLAVAAETATLGLPEVKRGLIAAGGGLVRLPAQLPRKRAMQLILTGEPLPAATALDWGLVNEVVPAAQVLPRAVELAQAISANAPLSVQASKRVALGILDGTVPDEATAWAANDAEMIAVMGSHDALEGATAFAEKRAPQWQAR